MPDQVDVVSKKTGRKMTIPRKRFDRRPDLFKLPPSKRGTQRQAAPSVEPITPAKPASKAESTEKEAADGAQT